MVQVASPKKEAVRLLYLKEEEGKREDSTSKMKNVRLINMAGQKKCLYDYLA